MFCSNCGKEIKENNQFCTSCGKKIIHNKPKVITEDINNNESNQQELKNKLYIFLNNYKKIIIIVISITISICVLISVFNNKDKQVLSTNSIDKIVQDNKYEVQFSKDLENEINRKRGSMTYYDVVNRIGEPYEVIEEYVGIGYRYKWIDKNGNSIQILFEENKKVVSAIYKENEIASTNFIDDIYTKYPELEDKEIICSNGDEYWLLDKNGKKVYFNDMESFENALKICNDKEDIVVVWKDMNDEQKKNFSRELLISKCKKERIGSEYIEGIEKNIIKEEILTENNSLTYIVMALTPKRWGGQTIYHYIDTYILKISANNNSIKWLEYDYSEYIENNIFDIEYNRLDSIGSSSYSSSSTSNINNISKEDLNKGIQKATEKVNEYLNKNQY